MAKKAKIASFNGIDIRVLTRKEHCGPHVHALHEGEGWELKIFFSYVSVQIVDVTLEAGIRPKQKVVQKCLDEVIDNLDDCREQYWEGVGLNCCLVNQLVMIDKDGYVWDAETSTPGALLVTTAKYRAQSKSLEFTAHGKTKSYTGLCP